MPGLRLKNETKAANRHWLRRFVQQFMAKELVDALSEGKWLKVQQGTWGHLKAKPGHHRGYMVFACGEYGDIVSIVSDFDGVSGSPWFFQAHNDFIGDHALERGKLYIFRGEYRRKKGDDCGHFVGDVKALDPASLLNKVTTQTL